MSSKTEKQKVVKKLKLVLEEGYALLDQRGVYKTPKIPKAVEKDFVSPIHSFRELIRQGVYPADYQDWAKQIYEIFIESKLDYKKFRFMTESIDTRTESDTPAAIFKNRLRELDSIVNDAKIFDSYLLLPANPEVKYAEGIVTQGYMSHLFTHPHHQKLILLLWQGRKIISPRGKELKSEKPMPKKILLEELNIKPARLETVIRSIKRAMNRKEIGLTIKYPNNVYIEVIQDIK
jgi:hypothetical protein